MAFTPAEKARIEFHLSYPLVDDRAALRSQGVNIASPIINELTHSIDAVKQGAESLVRALVQRLDCLLERIEKARDSIIVSQADNVKFNPSALPILWAEYRTERGRLADALVVDKYLYSYHTADEDGHVVEPC